jgi:hypothetical protein
MSLRKMWENPIYFMRQKERKMIHIEEMKEWVRQANENYYLQGWGYRVVREKYYKFLKGYFIVTAILLILLTIGIAKYDILEVIKLWPTGIVE